MLFKNPRRLLTESATADLLNPEVSDEVKDVIVDLEKDLTTNVEEVKEEDKATNGGIPVTTESVSIMESAVGYGPAKKARYLVTLENVIAVMESEAEAPTEEAPAADAGEAPTEEAPACEPSPVNVVEDIAEKNGVEPEQVAVVITAESAKFLTECALLESKAGKKGKKAKAYKKLAKLGKVVGELKESGVTIVRV